MERREHSAFTNATQRTQHTTTRKDRKCSAERWARALFARNMRACVWLWAGTATSASPVLTRVRVYA